MNRDDWRRAYEPLPRSLDGRVASALKQIEEEKPVKKFTVRTVALAMALILALAGSAWALQSFGIVDFLQGETLSPEAKGLIKTDFTVSTLKVGDVTFTLREMLADTFVGTAIVEARAPEGKYLFTDLVQMTEEEWNMDEAARYAKYGDYFWLLDTGIYFNMDGKKLSPPSEYSIGGVRESDNTVVMMLTFPTMGMDVSTLDIDVGVRHVTETGMEKAEKFDGDFIPGYELDTSAYKVFTSTPHKEHIDTVTVTVTPIMLHTAVTLYDLPELEAGAYRMLVCDKDGKEYDFTHLGSFGQDYQSDSIQWGCELPASLPESVFVHVYTENYETGEQKPVGEAVEISLK